MNQKGERNGFHRLTESEVLEIRRIWANNMSAKELAAKYGVATITIAKIVTQQCWKHLPSTADFVREREGR